VDVLQGSVGALASALIITGLKKKIRSLIVVAWLLGAYTFFIKPSGILIMGCLFPIFIVETAISWENKKIVTRNDFNNLLKFLLIGGGLAALSIYLAVSSGYLAKDIVQNAVIGQKLVIQMAHQPIVTQLKLFLNPVFGYWWGLLSLRPCCYLLECLFIHFLSGASRKWY
jgi:hypothetical protein